MYDLKLAVVGQDVATTRSYKDVIFVMEDVDAASKVVTPASSRRPGDDEQDDPRDHQRRWADADGRARDAETSTNDAAAAASAANDAARPVVAADARIARCGRRRGPTSSELNEGSTMKKEDAGAALLSKLLEVTDELNLAGLLNVLDGVVDTPERILIMTSNHPEKLDPALVRPGRIDKTIHARPAGGGGGADGKRTTSNVSDAQAERLGGLLPDSGAPLQLTPAMMEQLCARARYRRRAVGRAHEDKASGPMLVPGPRQTTRAAAADSPSRLTVRTPTGE